MNQDNPTQRFGTSAEAVEQGKRDLQEALRLNPAINLGVDEAQVGKSSAGQALAVTEVDFQKLLSTEGAVSLASLAGASRGNTTPLLDDGRVISLVETSSDAGGWKVSAIGNQAVREELNQIRATPYGGGELAYFEVPNLDARIYATTLEDGSTGYLTGYDGFSLRQPVAIEELLPRLRRDALEFQERHGEELKRGKLVR
ncbi:hypothetical protein FQY83_11965 [Luteimonas marina]|uniref:Uncharacterized protein n=1 Tax=Luteimonas marina TaxID=488485 RepID=A0A5C5U018_9GAMM|nr:hypothetical protein [Luteimonas marina]TWT19078.1 hypothetical protein FQY83_11965 [Luteimonas marina]